MEDEEKNRYDSSCTFCKIVSGELYSVKVFETKNTLAFMEISPANPGHVLVIPKEHYETIYDIDGDSLKDLMTISKDISKAIKKTFGPRGLDLVQKNGSAGGQKVEHFHMQLVPRDYGDNVKIDLNGESATEEELEDYAHRLRDNLTTEEEYEQKDKIEVALENIDKEIEHLEKLFRENKKLAKGGNNSVEKEKIAEQDESRS